MPTIYPFTAIVGQERMKRALILNAVDTRVGGVLIRGERGTAKSTAARALAALLPKVRAVKDCRFGCDPDNPTTWCTECKERAVSTKELPYNVRPIPFVNLPVSATEDRVVGTLDIEQAIQKGERHFEPERPLADLGRVVAGIDGRGREPPLAFDDDRVVDHIYAHARVGASHAPERAHAVGRCRAQPADTGHREGCQPSDRGQHPRSDAYRAQTLFHQRCLTCLLAHRSTWPIRHRRSTPAR